MDTKPIDLGKLQDALRSAKALVKSRGTLRSRAQDTMKRAQEKYDMAHANFVEAEKELDKATRAVVDGARAVANG